MPLQDKDRKATRKGIPFEKLTAEQKQKALALLKAGTSQSGNETAQAIMNLENVLKEAEKMGAMVRTPEWYFVTIFGSPSKTGKWGWRFEGHHMSLNTTLDGIQVVTATPFFFGANPASDPKTQDEGARPRPGAGRQALRLARRRPEEGGDGREGVPGAGPADEEPEGRPAERPADRR